jgi:hypothetical protein
VCRYKHLDLRPWAIDDVYTVEREGKIFTMNDRDCEDYYSVVRDALPQGGEQAGPFTPASSRLSVSMALSTGRRSTGGAPAISMAPLSPTPSRGSAGGGGGGADVDMDVDARVAALQARVAALEAYTGRFTRTYVPLIGLLFAFVQVLLPLFIGLVSGALAP